MSPKVKRGLIIFWVLFILVFGGIFTWNINSYISLKNNPGFVLGKIYSVKKHSKRRSYKSYYKYTVNNKTYCSQQGSDWGLNKPVLIMYDTTDPGFSIIVRYSDTIKNLKEINKEKVKYSYWDYLPLNWEE